MFQQFELVFSFRLLLYLCPSCRSTTNKWFSDLIMYFCFDYIVYDGVGAFSIATGGWNKPLVTKQTTALYVLNGIALFFALINVFLFSRVFLSSYTMEFSVSRRAKAFLLLLGKHVIFEMPIYVVENLFTGILFIPALNVFLSALKVGTTDVANYWPFLTLGIVGTIVHIVSTTFAMFVLFTCNPKSLNVDARYNTYGRFFFAVLRVVLVALQVFAPNAAIVKPLVVTVVCMGMSSYFANRLPYIKMRGNNIQFTLMNALSIAGVLGIVKGGMSKYVDGDHILTAFYIFWPLVMIISYAVFPFLYRKKTRSLGMSLLNTAMGLPSDRRIQFYEAELKKRKFSSPEEVEISTRFLVEDVPEEHQKELVAIATAIYQRGVQQFGNNMDMLAYVTLFYAVHVKDFAAWKIYLTKAEPTKAPYFAAYLLAQSEAEHESHLKASRTSGNAENELTNAEATEIFNNLKTSKRFSRSAKKYVILLWRQILTGNVDAAKVRKQITKIYNNEVLARRLLQATIEKFPDDLSALNTYVGFLEVQLNTRVQFFMWFRKLPVITMKPTKFGMSSSKFKLRTESSRKRKMANHKALKVKEFHALHPCPATVHRRSLEANMPVRLHHQHWSAANETFRRKKFVNFATTASRSSV